MAQTFLINDTMIKAKIQKLIYWKKGKKVIDREEKHLHVCSKVFVSHIKRNLWLKKEKYCSVCVNRININTKGSESHDLGYQYWLWNAKRLTQSPLNCIWITASKGLILTYQCGHNSIMSRGRVWKYFCFRL